jgi:PrtD family type I secretion system ABC transporter
MKTPDTLLGRSLTALRGGFLAAAAFSVFANLLLLVPSLYMLQVYDRVLASRSVPTLAAITLIALAALAVLAGLDAVRSRILVRLGTRLELSLRSPLFDAAWQGGQGAEPLRDLSAFREALTGPGMIALFDAPWVPVFIGLAFIMHPLIGLVATGGAVVIVVLALVNARLSRPASARAAEASAEAWKIAGEARRHAEAVQALGMGDALRTRWLASGRKALTGQAEASDRSGMVLAVSKSARFATQVVLLGTGAMLVIGGEMSAGMMIAASVLMGRALAPVEGVVAHWRVLSNGRAAFGRLHDVLAAVSSTEPAGLVPPPPLGRLEIANLTVAAPGADHPTLRNITFTVAPGEVLGVVGGSGAGKTSLVRALLGVWPAQAGTVRLDGYDIATWPRDDLGRHTGYLPQEVALFEGTVAQNIARMGAMDRDAVIAAARQAGAHEMIQRLPHGYDTPVGESGRALSGGQRQRIGLARAVFGSPAVIVLDEPNAGLDAEGETALLAALDTLRGEGRTVIVVAHRATLLAACDRIAVLRDGGLDVLGARDDVLARLVGRGPRGGGVTHFPRSA